MLPQAPLSENPVPERYVRVEPHGTDGRLAIYESAASFAGRFRASRWGKPSLSRPLDRRLTAFVGARPADGGLGGSIDAAGFQVVLALLEEAS